MNDSKIKLWASEAETLPCRAQTTGIGSQQGLSICLRSVLVVVDDTIVIHM